MFQVPTLIMWSVPEHAPSCSPDTTDACVESQILHPDMLREARCSPSWPHVAPLLPRYATPKPGHRACPVYAPASDGIVVCTLGAAILQCCVPWYPPNAHTSPALLYTPPVQCISPHRQQLALHLIHAILWRIDSIEMAGALHSIQGRFEASMEYEDRMDRMKAGLPYPRFYSYPHEGWRHRNP